MRLGAPIFGSPAEPAGWAAAVRHEGWRAAYAPDIAPGFSPADYAAAAHAADIVIAEVGVWNNPLAADPERRAEALRACQNKLALADELGAACCVNISGSRGEPWDGPHPANLTAETFDLVVESVRTVLDAVKPRRTTYTLETMPWMFPHSANSYERLLRAVDRPALAVHFDPVNLVTSPEACFQNAALMRDFIRRLGPHIRSVHVKDIRLAPKLTVHLDEVRPGLGVLDHGVLLAELARLPTSPPVMLEHLATADDYWAAAEHLRQQARRAGVSLVS